MRRYLRWNRMILVCTELRRYTRRVGHLPPVFSLKGYSSGQSHFSQTNVKLAEKNKYATLSVQRSLEMCENKEKPTVYEDFRQKMFYQLRRKVPPVT